MPLPGGIGRLTLSGRAPPGAGVVAGRGPGLKLFVIPYVITIIKGLILPSAIILSIIRFARPWLLHAVSSSPQPCCRYNTGYFVLPFSYPGGVYTNARREVFVL